MVECMIRFYILAINEGRNIPEFNEKYNLIRMTNLLGTLMVLYENYDSPNADEFYGYNLLFLTYNAMDFERIMHLIPSSLFDSHLLQSVLKMISAIKNDAF